MEHRDISIDAIITETRKDLENRISELKDAINHPEKYTRRAVLSFDYTDFKSGKPFTIKLNENGNNSTVILDPEMCVNFDVIRNNTEYNAVCINYEGELILFDYEAINKDDAYDYANMHVFELEADDMYKTYPKIMFIVEGQIGNIERNGTEFFVYDFEKGLLVSNCRIYFDNPNGYNIKPGEFYKIEFLLHEHSLAVIGMEKINKPSKYKKLECFWDYKEK